MWRHEKRAVIKEVIGQGDYRPFPCTGGHFEQHRIGTRKEKT